MSIVVLKRKTQHQYGKISHDKGFSLNGTIRNIGYIGRDLTGRHLLRSLAKGTALKGHGGCCGTFKIHEYISSDINTTETQNTIKMSSVSSTGLIHNKTRWARRPFPYSSTKHVDGYYFTQSAALARIKACLLDRESKNKPKVEGYRDVKCKNLNSLVTKEACTVPVEDPEYKTYTSYELYMNNLIGTCASVNDTPRVNTISGRTPNTCG
jgi:hypothetical protein